MTKLQPFALTTENILLGLVLAGIGLSSMHTKLAGLAWLGVCLWGIWAWARYPRTTHCPAALRIWLLCLLGFATLLIGPTLAWGDPLRERDETWRLILPCLALIAVHQTVPLQRRQQLQVIALHGAALACWGALGMAWIMGRNLPSNAIPWAMSMAFWVSLVWVAAWSPTANPAHRWIWGISALAGSLAIALSLSRSAYLIYPLMALVAWRQAPSAGRLRRWVRPALAIGFVAGLALLSQYTQVGPGARVYMTLQEIAALSTGQAPIVRTGETATHTRWHLWHKATQKIAEQPLTGHGRAQRLQIIRATGLAVGSAEILRIGHLHNQYLHDTLDYGIAGALAHVTLLAGLLLLALKTRGATRLSVSLITALHFFASIFNVNFAHNYYATMLSLALFIALLAFAPPDAPPPQT